MEKVLMVGSSIPLHVELVEHFSLCVATMHTIVPRDSPGALMVAFLLAFGRSTSFEKWVDCLDDGDLNLHIASKYVQNRKMSQEIIRIQFVFPYDY